MEKKEAEKLLFAAHEKVDQIAAILYHEIDDLTECIETQSRETAERALNLCYATESVVKDISELMEKLEVSIMRIKTA